MGGLKKELPITYWTFLIGALAIAGVPLLSGLLQQGRDPVPHLRAAATGCSGSIGALTSLLTAIYMFRLVFLTFHGERARSRAHAGHGSGTRRTAVRHGHGGGHLHDAPAGDGHSADHPGASGSVLAGYVGVPHALGGENRIERSSHPAFHPAAAMRRGTSGGDAPPRRWAQPAATTTAPSRRATATPPTRAPS